MSNHSVVTGSFMRVLARLLGDERTFVLTANSLPGLSRVYHRFSDSVTEVAEARILGGIHFRTACDVGKAAGEQLGDYLVDNFLVPLETEDEQ